VQLVSKISNLCDPDPPTLQTDRQHAISIPRFAYLVHRAVNTGDSKKLDKLTSYTAEEATHVTNL